MLPKVSAFFVHSFFNNFYIQKKLNVFLLFLVSFILRNIIDLILYYYISTGLPTLDFITSVCITILITLNKSFFEMILYPLNPYFLKITSYLSTNYMYFDIWREKFIFVTSIVLLFFFWLFDINSKFFIYNLSHFLVVCTILNILQNYNNSDSFVFFIRQLIEPYLTYSSIKITIHKPLSSSMIFQPSEDLRLSETTLSSSTIIPNPHTNISPNTQNWMRYLKSLNQLFTTPSV